MFLSPYPSSSEPSFSPAAGTVSAASTAVVIRSTRHGRPATQSLSRAQPLPSVPDLPKNGMRSALIRWPRIPSSAGTSVMEVSTAQTTEIPVIQPSAVSTGNPASMSALSAMITVPPANTTAPPELEMVCRTASTTGTPSASRRRYRESRKSA